MQNCQRRIKSFFNKSVLGIALAVGASSLPVAAGPVVTVPTPVQILVHPISHPGTAQDDGVYYVPQEVYDALKDPHTTPEQLERKMLDAPDGNRRSVKYLAEARQELFGKEGAPATNEDANRLLNRMVEKDKITRSKIAFGFLGSAAGVLGLWYGIWGRKMEPKYKPK